MINLDSGTLELLINLCATIGLKAVTCLGLYLDEALEEYNSLKVVNGLLVVVVVVVVGIVVVGIVVVGIELVSVVSVVNDGGVVVTSEKNLLKYLFNFS
jgi:hypothetical protein